MRLRDDNTRRLFAAGEIELLSTPDHLLIDIEGRQRDDAGQLRQECVRVQLSHLAAAQLRDRLDDAMSQASISDGRQAQMWFYAPEPTGRDT